MAPGDAPDSRAQSVEASVHSEGHDDAAPEAEPVGHRDSAPQLITDIIAAPIPRLVAGDLDETALSAGVIRDAPETASSDGEPSAADGERADSEQDASSAAAITEEVLAIPTGEAYAPGAKSGESVESAAAGIDADVAAASDAPVSQPQKNDVNVTAPMVAVEHGDSQAPFTLAQAEQEKRAPRTIGNTERLLPSVPARRDEEPPAASKVPATPRSSRRAVLAAVVVLGGAAIAVALMSKGDEQPVPTNRTSPASSRAIAANSATPDDEATLPPTRVPDPPAADDAHPVTTPGTKGAPDLAVAPDRPPVSHGNAKRTGPSPPRATSAKPTAIPCGDPGF